MRDRDSENPKARGKSAHPGRRTARPPPRPVARLVVCLAILVLGGVAAWRLELSYLPGWSFPELIVSLRLPETADVEDVTRLRVQPLESAIRAVGDATSTAGEVSTNGAFFRVRFRSGTDAERKAARLESELAGLRRALPEGSRLDVRPAGRGGGDFSMFVWIGEDSRQPLSRGLLQAVRSLPAVRRLEVAGESLRELRVTANAGVDPVALRRAVDGHLAVRSLGESAFAGRRLPVYLRPAPATPIGDLAVRDGARLLPLAALAEQRLATEEAPYVVHRQGRRGQVLVVSREPEASPLELERSLGGVLDRYGLGSRYRVILSEAGPMKTLLRRLTAAFVAAILVTAALAAALGGPRAAALQALALPVSLAAALNAFWLAGLTLDVTTLPMLAMALAWCLILRALASPSFSPRPLGEGPGVRASAATAIAASALFPIAVALAGGRVAPLFQTPTRAFLCAQLAGVAALAVLPPAPIRRLPPFASRPLRAALRRPWTVLLATVTATWALFVLFGSALQPRPGPLSPVTADLRVELQLAAGTTPAQAEKQVSIAERELSSHEEIAEHWSFFNERGGVVNATVRSRDRSLGALRRLAGRLQLALNLLGSAARVTPLASGSSRGDRPVRFSDSLEDRAETDEGAQHYRFLLRGTDLRTLRTTHTRILERLTGMPRIGREQVESGWGRPGTRVELVPRAGAPPEETDAALAVLRRRAFRPPRRPLPSAAEVGLRVAGADAPASPDEVRQRADLLAAPLPIDGGGAVVPAVLFDLREVLASPAVRRQSGRFVLPVTVYFHGVLKRFEDRAAVDRLLRWFPIPAGCDVELPALETDFFSPERRRMLAIAGTLPLLLWALAAVRLDSLWRAGVALAPLAIGIAASTPIIRATKGNVDEMTLFALAAMAVGALPLSLWTVASAPAPAAAYRRLARHGGAFAVAAAGLALLLAVPGAGVDADRHPWSQPHSLAAVAGVASVVASVFCVPGLLLAVSHWRGRGGRRDRRRATVAVWRAPGALELETRRLTKVYGDGFRALDGVSFRLEPGIIGLLGPNGAGKTTLLRTLCGLLEPTRGRVLYRGVAVSPDNLPEYRRLVGFLPQSFNAYAGFTGARFLDYWALEKGLADPRQRRREIERRLAQVGLEDAAGRKVRDYSGGMRRRIGIARALLGDPPIVIVDEPTTGLDVAARNRLRESLLSVAGERVIVFSTHIASDVAAAAARILLLHDGRLLYDGPAAGLVDRARGRVFETLVDDAELRDFSHRFRVTTRVRTLDGIRVRAVAPDDAGVENPPGEAVEPNLEEAYLAMIGGRGWRRKRRRAGGSLLDLGG